MPRMRPLQPRSCGASPRGGRPPVVVGSGRAPTGRSRLQGCLSHARHPTCLTPSYLLLLPLQFIIPWVLSPPSAATAPLATCSSTRASFSDSSCPRLRLALLHLMPQLADAIVNGKGVNLAIFYHCAMAGARQSSRSTPSAHSAPSPSFLSRATSSP
jgi:hypothetical protein